MTTPRNVVVPAVAGSANASAAIAAARNSRALYIAVCLLLDRKAGR
jgi:hypothetical protein